MRTCEATVTTGPSPPGAADGSERDPPQVLQIRWSVHASAIDEHDQHQFAVASDWLRKHCTSPTARYLRQRDGTAIDGVSCRPSPVLWNANVFTPSSDRSPPCMDYRDVVAGKEQGSASQGAAHLVSLIRSHGIALVRGVPTDEAGTKALALKVGGHLQSTLYGPGMWATSADTEAGEDGFRDGAYSSDALDSHTDCAYLTDPPGLQVRVGTGHEAIPFAYVRLQCRSRDDHGRVLLIFFFV